MIIDRLDSKNLICRQPPITSNDECLPGSVVHCIDDGDHNNLRDLFELDVDELLQLDVDDLLERFGHDN
jgi:hypothetical protein